MALIHSIRRRSSFLIGIITIGLIFFLIGGDLLRVKAVLSGQHRTEVGMIAGEAITFNEYRDRIEQLRYAMPDQSNQRIQQRAWQQLTLSKALKKEVDTLGLVISDEELVDLVQGNHIHPAIQNHFRDPATKQFKKQQLITYLQMLPHRSLQEQMQWQSFEHNIALHRREEKLAHIFNRSNLVTSLEKQKKQHWDSHTLDIKYLYIPYYSCSDDEVTITDKMLIKHLETHKNAYQIQENRSIQYVVFPIHPTTEDQKELEKEVKKLKNAFQKARNTRAFAEINTDADASAAYLSLTATQLPRSLTERKKSLRENMVVGPIKESNGYKLYKVISLPNTKEQLYEIAVIEKQYAAGDQAYNQAFQKASHCANEVNNMVQLAAYADQHNITTHDAEIAAQDTQVGALPQARELVRWLYNNAHIGSVSPVFELGKNYVIAIMTDRVPAGTAPLTNVKNELTLKVKNEQKARIITEKLQQVSTATLEEKMTLWGKKAKLLTCKALRFADDTLEQTGIARNTIGAAFALTPGSQATVADDNGVIVIEVLKRNQIASPAQEKELPDHQDIMQQIIQMKQKMVLEKSLEELADIKDYRYKFY